MKLDLVIRELHSAELALHRDLLDMSERHHAEHEIHHVTRDLADWCEDHVARLAHAGEQFDLHLDSDITDNTGTVAAIRRAVSDLTGRRSEPGLRLLADLRGLHRDTAGVSLDWELLAQAAQAMKETELLELSQRCHPQTLRQLKWSNAMLKTLSPQVLAS